ncbi:uncharacterized protein METZ01_LOCUS61548 [marine metagenome]|uniref:Uncharacterized protein n=1 Tax=marine metagenome TaxID=408172 RepID=A0A381SZ68_9ZZZZ
MENLEADLAAHLHYRDLQIIIDSKEEECQHKIMDVY